MVLRVQLREHRPFNATLVRDTKLQRRRPSRALEPDELHLEDREPELLLHRPPDRFAPPATDIQVRRLAALPVPHGEDVARGEGAEQRHRDRHAEDDREREIGRMVDAEVDAIQGHPREDGDDGELRVPTRAAGNHQHVDEPHEHGGERRDRL